MFCRHFIVSFVLSWLIFSPRNIHAQLMLGNQGASAEIIANSLVTGGVTISNPIMNCPTNAYATFTNGLSTNLGVPSGLVMTTGNVNDLNAPGSSFMSTANGTTCNDPQLISLEPLATNDCCILEFDVIPTCDQLQLRFVFGSEEYPEWVSSGFNDSFGFFITGQNPSGVNYVNSNVAVLPDGSNTIVSIDNVNAGMNASFYLDNSTGSTNIFDAFTTVIVTDISVVACETYHFKLAIADAGDGVWDSGVFIEFLECPSALETNISSTTVSCNGSDGTATVNASGGFPPYTYAWNTVPPQTTPTVSNLSPGIYEVTILDEGPCTDPVIETIEVVSDAIIPIISINSETICLGDLVTLTASPSISGGTYLWSTGETTASINISPNATTSYSCDYDLNGCLTSATTSVIVNTTEPGVDIQNACDSFTWIDGITYNSNNNSATFTIIGGGSNGCDSTVTLDLTIENSVTPAFDLGPYCQNETPAALPVTSLDGYTGTWSPSVIDVSVAGIAIYTFTPDPGQCAVPATMEILVTPLLVPDFLQIDPFCLNETAPVLPVLSQGGISGNWTPAIINTSTVGISTYTFTPDVSQCADVVTMEIEVLTLPTVIFAEEQLITCITNTSGAQIGMSGVVGNTYSWSPTAGLSNPSIGDPIASPATTTLYTLTVTDASGCSEDGMVTVTVDDTPPVVAIENNTGSTTLTCTQLEINVTATGAVAYNWDNGLGNITSPSITAPGIYTVTGTGANGCESSTQFEVIQDNSVDLFLALSQPEICTGEAVNLSINSSNATDFNWTVIQNGATGASNGTASNNGFGASISEVLTITGVGNGTVDYTVEPVLGPCIGEAQIVSVTVLAEESPQFNQLGPFCINDVASALPTNSLEGIAGTWSPSVVSTTSAGTSTYSFTPNSGQCAANQTMDIVVNELPAVSFSGDSLVGCAPHTVVLTSESSSSTWTISNGVMIEGNEVTIVLTNPGCYDVTLEVDENGCTNSLTMTDYVCLEEEPIAVFTASPDLFTDNDVLVTFTNMSSGASSFIWDFGDGNTSSYINPSNLYENTNEGALITLTAISDFGCMDEAQLIIEYDEQEIFYIPNTFTPDGDNFNQIFTPVFYSGFDPYNFEMLIFNRWGEIVFESHNTEIGWDGSYGVNGTKALDGTYSWKITYKSPKTDERKVVVGYVTLMR